MNIERIEKNNEIYVVIIFILVIIGAVMTGVMLMGFYEDARLGFLNIILIAIFMSIVKSNNEDISSYKIKSDEYEFRKKILKKLDNISRK